jgi:dCTP deaminase
MILKADKIANELQDPPRPGDPLIITPMPDLDELRKSGSAALNMRLGCWFLACRQTQIGLLDIYDNAADLPSEASLTKSYYVPFGEAFVLHPRSFVLGVTLEWIRLPGDRAAYVVGRSSWGRYGLIIATATGVHPGFTGCLTLELSNIGEVPIRVKPGTQICQIFLHKVESGEEELADRSSFIGRRKPALGLIELDKIAQQLAKLAT